MVKVPKKQFPAAWGDLVFPTAGGKERALIAAVALAKYSLAGEPSRFILHLY